MEHLVQEYAGNLTAVARKLGISRPTLYKRLRHFGVRLEMYRRL